MVLELGPKHLYVGAERILVGLGFWCSCHDVLKRYRGVGLLQYWTLSNLPLFLLAAPMLYILLKSSYWTWRVDAFMIAFPSEQGSKNYSGKAPWASATGPDLHIDRAIARRFAIPQVVLAALALTSYHVQIINRLSSGYPIWYWWLASLILIDCETSVLGMRLHYSGIVLRCIVIYAMVQGGLFASFLPPA